MADDTRIEITLKVSSSIITLKVSPEMEPYFRKAAKLVNHRLDSFAKHYSGGEMSHADFLITVAIEGMVESQKNQDKYTLLQQSLKTRLDDLENRLSLN